MSPQPEREREGHRCNGYGHAPDCTCGWGGVYYTSASPHATMGGPIPPSGTRAVWEHAEFCRPTTCPECHAPVFFVRHNGGSVWFDTLGQPWPKHPCMAREHDIRWLERDFPGDEPGNRKVFGVIQEATVVEPGTSAFFVIRCSDGTIIKEEFVYTLNPCEAVGGLVRLELTPGNRVGARRFKAIDDMLEAHAAMLKREERRKKGREMGKRAQEKIERREYDDTKHGFSIRRKTGTLTIKFVANQDEIEAALGARGFNVYQEIVDRGPKSLALVAAKTKVVITPSAKGERHFSLTVSSKELDELLGGQWPTDDSWGAVVQRLQGWRNRGRSP